MPAEIRCGVVGDPIAHSLSPALHRAGFSELGVVASYDATRVEAGGLAEHVAQLGPQWRGLSVTAPLKREAMALAAEVTDTARIAGGANTLVRLPGGHGWSADNTDLPGAVAAVRERYAGDVHAVTILGGGATASSTALALARLGARRVRLLVREVARADDTAAALRAHAHLEVEVGLLGDETIGEVVVSTVPAAAQTPDVVRSAASAAVVFEVVYDPWPTPLAAAAAARGQVVVSGLDLLVHQGVLQQHAFAEVAADPEQDLRLVAALRAAGEAELARRAGA
ncbi:shikimate dehydrogenase [Nocardioides sp.]|uniref:shikimate dehydrogenase n=1 Tax=Nocardioides sp. TaxID=35761 RepID=UPI003518D56D